MEVVGGMAALMSILVSLALAILAILVPVFVFLIYREAVQTNEHLRALRGLTDKAQNMVIAPPNSIRVDCPQCGISIFPNRKTAGKIIRCGRCKTKITVPQPEGDLPGR